MNELPILSRGNGKSQMDLDKICKILSEKPKIEPFIATVSRTEKRRIEKEKSKANKVLNMTVKALDDIIKAAKDDERQRIFKFVADYYSAAIALVLHDKWGFGHDRLTRVVAQINETYEGILDEYVDIEDIRKALLEETGVKL